MNLNEARKYDIKETDLKTNDAKIPNEIFFNNKKL